MRDQNRIPEFIKELERIWMQYYPDWRFGQLMINFLNYVALEHKRDPFFPEESDMLKYLKEYAKKSPYYKENKWVRRIIYMSHVLNMVIMAV